MSDTTTNNTKMAWLVFFISTLACIAFLMFLPEWFWVTLPFVLTSLVKAMDAM